MDLRYPIGTFEKPVASTATDRARWIGDEALPARCGQLERRPGRTGHALSSRRLDGPPWCTTLPTTT
jgi:hypothetical protein